MSLAEFDVTELPQTDDLNRPTGPALEAMSLAAAAFGAGVTRFITSGTTTALHIMLALVVGRGGSLFLPRGVHQSVVHAAALLDLQLNWLEAQPLAGEQANYGLLPLVTAEQVESALDRHPACSTVFLTSPDYYGFCPDLTAIAEVVHRHGAQLIVDEAHGAHLAFGGSQFPVSALRAGADACVQSGHKTLPVMTPGAMIHLSAAALSAGRISLARLDSLIPVFQTSSPSFPVAATLDYARAWLSQSGQAAIDGQLDCLARFRAALPPGLGCTPLAANHDPLRVVLAAEPGQPPLAAHALAAQLAAAGIDIEFADLTRLVLIPSLLQPTEAWQQLTAVLQQITLTFGNKELEKEWQLLLGQAPETALPPGDVLFGRHPLQRLPLTQAAGRISARAILPYPPGIPLIWPGEKLDHKRVDFLRRLLENNISISGLDQDSLWVLL